MIARQQYRAQFFRWRMAGIAACVLAVAACWIIPARLALHPDGAWYAFAYSADETAYMWRVDLLPAGASANNVFNSVSDPNVISPYFLDRLIRAFLVATGMDVIAFFWAWRLLFPAALIMLYYWLARVCRGNRVSQRPLNRLLASFALLLTYALYYMLVDLQTVFFQSIDYVPIFMLLNRVPTNIEFLLGVAFIACFVAWARTPTVARGVALCATLVFALYLRPYIAIPAAAAVILAVGWRAVRRELTLAQTLLPAGFLTLAIMPWWLIERHNQTSEAYRDQMVRMFHIPYPYAVHERWWLYGLIAGIVLLASRFVSDRARLAMVCSAISLAVFPFYAGLLKVARELLANDRFSCFYLPLLFASGFLLLRHRRQRQPGREAVSAKVAAVFAASFLAVTALSFRFEFKEPFLPAFIKRDRNYFTAYEWVRDNTPADALFLVDDGFDWSQVPDNENAMRMALTQHFFFHFDMFSHIARRPRVYTELLYVYYLKEQELDELSLLHWGTFGLKRPGYDVVLKRFQPDFIFWRRTPPIFEADRTLPIPRGYFGILLQRFSTTVYQDDYCEIWQMDYTRTRSSQPQNGSRSGQ
ncbi:MAG TPA: hypothetical protein VEK08_07930 [Planctomycetota bacterium]|nr:hypothetical protein [Planctomycetota bacterium]